jgi:hypothetical protein
MGVGDASPGQFAVLCPVGGGLGNKGVQASQVSAMFTCAQRLIKSGLAWSSDAISRSVCSVQRQLLLRCVR